MGAVVGAIFPLLFAPQSAAGFRASNQTEAEEDWQLARSQWQIEQENSYPRLAQLQVDLKQTEKQEAEPGKEVAQTM